MAERLEESAEKTEKSAEKAVEPTGNTEKSIGKPGDKIKVISDGLYYISAVIYFVFSIIATSHVRSLLGSKRYILIMAGMLGLLMLRELLGFVFLKRYGIREVIGLLICGFFWYIAEKNDSSILVCSYLLVFASRNVDMKKAYKIILVVMVLTCSTIFLLAENNVILNSIYYDEGRFRHIFGFHYPLIPPCHLLNITMVFAVLKSEKISFSEIGILFFLNGAIYRWCRADLSGAVTLVVLLFMILVKLYPKILTMDFLLWELLDRIAVVVFPLCMALSLGISICYSDNVGWMKALDDATRGRLHYPQQAIARYGFSMLGQNISFIGMGVDGNAHGEYNYVDNLYISLLLRYGVLFMVIGILLLTVTMYYLYQKKMRIWLWMLSLWALHGLLEDRMHLVYFNSLLLIIGQAVQNVSGPGGRG